MKGRAGHFALGWCKFGKCAAFENMRPWALFFLSSTVDSFCVPNPEIFFSFNLFQYMFPVKRGPGVILTKIPLSDVRAFAMIRIARLGRPAESRNARRLPHDLFVRAGCATVTKTTNQSNQHSENPEYDEWLEQGFAHSQASTNAAE